MSTTGQRYRRWAFALVGVFVIALAFVTAGLGSAALLGQFMASSFVSAGEGHGAVPLADPSANLHPQLAQPHSA